MWIESAPTRKKILALIKDEKLWNDHSTEKKTVALVTYQKTSVKCVAALNQRLQIICKGTQNRTGNVKVPLQESIANLNTYLVPSSQKAETRKLERGCWLRKSHWAEEPLSTHWSEARWDSPKGKCCGCCLVPALAETAALALSWRQGYARWALCLYP